jgi:hypothetical protein
VSGLSLAWQQPAWLLLLPLVWAWSLWTLGRTRPSPAGGLRRLLGGLRLAAWTLLLALLAGPRLSWEERREEAPLLAVLLDESASLPHLNGRLDHRDWLPELAGSLPDVELRLFAYGDTLRELDDPLEPLGGLAPRSDLDGALAEVERRLGGGHLAGILLVGDGNPTAGPWPTERVRRSAARLWTAGTGRREAPPDLLLRALDLNDPVPAGRPQPVEVELEHRGLGGRSARLSLLVDGRRVAERSLVLPAQDGRLRERFQWTPRRPGLARVEGLVEVVGPAGNGEDGSLANNRRLAQVRVQPGQRPVLLLAGEPSPDLALLRRVLESQPELETWFALPGRPGTDRAALLAALERAELLVLVGWPRGGSDPALVAAAREALSRRPALVVEAPGMRLDELGALPLLPSGANPRRLGEGPQALQVHPVLGDELRLDELAAIWRELPPVTALRPEARLRDGARLLLAGEGGEPLLALSRSASRRQAQLAAAGVWRWAAGSQLSLGENRRAEAWAGALLRWCLAPPEERLFEVAPEEAVVPAGSAPLFRARLRAEDGRPLEGARVELTLVADSSGLRRGLVLAAQGEGRYAGRAPALEAGGWRWEALARLGEGPALIDSGRVEAEAFSPEWLDAVRGQRLLDELAAAGGGSALDLDDPAQRAALAAGEPFADLDRRPLQRIRGRSREAMDAAPLLIALLLLLALDWLLRRLRGML